MAAGPPPDYHDIAKDFLLALNEGKFYGDPAILARSAFFAVRQLQKKCVTGLDDDNWVFEYTGEPPG